MRIAYYTLGCKVNQYDTQMMREILEKAGHVSIDFNSEADCYIINTCSVTNMSDKKSRQIISRCKRKAPNSIIVVCGCFSQISPEAVASIEGVDIVLGTANRKNILLYLNEHLQFQKQIRQIPVLSYEKKLCGEFIEKFEEKTRAILKIEDGCQNFCSYCLIPYARGPIRSKTKEDIKTELTDLKKNGYQEIVITGIHLASYGKDINSDLAEAINTTCEFGFKRVRLGSLEPNIITKEFLNKIKDNANLMPSFHLSLQSGSDTVLKRMNRHYTATEYQNAVNLLREYYPSCAITTDIIVGFPGETNEEFTQTLEFAKNISFAKIHIFPYSARAGTKAERMANHISTQIKNVRCKELQKAETQTRFTFMNKHIGKILKVLFEQKKGSSWEGYSENYIPVKVTSVLNLEGKLTEVKIISTDNDGLIGEIVI